MKREKTNPLNLQATRYPNNITSSMTLGFLTPITILLFEKNCLYLTPTKRERKLMTAYYLSIIAILSEIHVI